MRTHKHLTSRQRTLLEGVPAIPMDLEDPEEQLEGADIDAPAEPKERPERGQRSPKEVKSKLLDRYEKHQKPEEKPEERVEEPEEPEEPAPDVRFKAKRIGAGISKINEALKAIEAAYAIMSSEKADYSRAKALKDMVAGLNDIRTQMKTELVNLADADINAADSVRDILNR